MSKRKNSASPHASTAWCRRSRRGSSVPGARKSTRLWMIAWRGWEYISAWRAFRWEGSQSRVSSPPRFACGADYHRGAIAWLSTLLRALRWLLSFAARVHSFTVDSKISMNSRSIGSTLGGWALWQRPSGRTVTWDLTWREWRFPHLIPRSGRMTSSSVSVPSVKFFSTPCTAGGRISSCSKPMMRSENLRITLKPRI